MVTIATMRAIAAAADDSLDLAHEPDAAHRAAGAHAMRRLAAALRAARQTTNDLADADDTGAREALGLGAAHARRVGMEV